MHLILTVNPFVLAICAALFFGWLALKVRTVSRSYLEEKVQAEKDEKIERLEADVSRLTKKDIL